MAEAEFVWIEGTGEGFEHARAVRLAVFVEEQGFSEASEFDETDNTALHIIGLAGGQAVCTGRLFAEAAAPAGEYHIGRVAVLSSQRGQGLGLQMLWQLEARARQLGAREMVLHSQADKADFYRRAGYAATGDVFLDEGCPHMAMRKSV